jgi:hypothetical protein
VNSRAPFDLLLVERCELVLACAELDTCVEVAVDKLLLVWRPPIPLAVLVLFLEAILKAF